MIEQTIYWYSIEEYGLPTGMDSRGIWMVFKNVSSNKFEVRKIERDYFSNDWYFSDCDEMVEFISDSFIPIMWTDSFNNTILKTIIKE
jgi:hypothetical protein